MAPRNPNLEQLQRETAARLVLIRGVLGKDQSEFADLAGIARNTYNQYENAKRLPNIVHALALRDAYNITLDWIYAGDISGLPYKIGAEVAKRLPPSD